MLQHNILDNIIKENKIKKIAHKIKNASFKKCKDVRSSDNISKK